MRDEYIVFETDDDTPWPPINPSDQLLIDQEKWYREVFLEYQKAEVLYEYLNKVRKKWMRT